MTARVRLVPVASDRVAVSAALHAHRHSDPFTLKHDDPAFYQNAHLGWQTGADAAARVALATALVAVLGEVTGACAEIPQRSANGAQR